MERAQPRRDSAQLFLQYALDLAFHHAFHGREQEAELGRHPHRALFQRNRAINAAAVEVQHVAAPVRLQAKTLGQFAGNLLDGLARLVVGQGMGVADIDVGHGGSCLAVVGVRACIVRMRAAKAKRMRVLLLHRQTTC